MPLPPILHEDTSLLAFDKPSGMLVAPDRWDKARENLMGLVHATLGKTVANVHRLDADTSGVLLCTKNKPALDFVSGQFQSKTVTKVYHALVVGAPEVDTELIDLPLGEDEHQLGRMRVRSGRGGKPAETEVRVLTRFRGYTWVECRPLTGRTHQIRVHLAARGIPILCDPFYGDPAAPLLLSTFKRGYKGREDERPLLKRLALHASELTVTHPDSRLPHTLHSPLPKEFEIALKYLRKYAG